MLWLWFTIPGAIVLLGILLFLFSIFPALRRHSYRKQMDGMYIAHRGLHDLPDCPPIPENSMPAFRKAIDAGYAIETDIHLTKDGKIIVFHDHTFDRICGFSGTPEDMTFDEIRALSLQGTGERIPSLSELLDEVNGRVPLLIEFKCLSRAQSNALCIAAAPILDAYNGPYMMESFHPTAVEWYRKNRPAVCRGQLAAGFRDQSLVRRISGCLLFNLFGRPDFVSYDHRDAAHPCRRLCTRLGAFPVCWTLHNREELDAARTNGFRSFIFEGFIPE